MNLTERAEIRKETFYKLTNSRDVPEAPSVGGRNYLHGTSTSYQKYTGTNYIVGYPSTYKDWNKLLDPLRGKTVTLKAYIKNDTNFPVRIQMWFTGGGIYGNAIPAHSEGWSVKTGKVSSNWTSANVAFTQGGQNTTGGTIQAKEVKVEVSETATPYSQAPEDFGWSTTAPVPTPTQRYLWKFEYIYYSDDSVEVTQPTNISIAGVNGQTSHVHFAFADNATGGGFSLTTPKAYMGWYADFNEAASTDPTKYRWSKWKGDQGAPGKPGADGKTSYFHMAYADSADGRTGFSFKESGQQYQGYYTDFTQTSSTDPNNYTWMDRRAGVEVGSKNLLRKTAINAENLKLFGKSNTTVSVVEKDGHQAYKLVVSGSSNAGAYFNGNSDYYNLVKDRSYTFSFWVLTNKDKTYSSGSLGLIQAVNNNSDKVGNDNLHQHTTPVYSTNTIKANTWTKVWCTFKATSNSYFKPYFWYLTAGDEIYIYDMMLNEGTIPLSHSLAPEDAQEQIDSKADQTLTQEQLNALAEKNNLIKAEMEAKASIDTVDKWITAYENYVKANDADKAKSEQALKEASERILGMRYEVNDLKFVWDAIDRFMSFQNEGLVIGKKDGSAYAKFSDDRISLFSGSSEVMYISQGTLNIANGIFTKTIQIGRFRFETHPADADMLVLRYLGG